jgi:hypothetical protein
MAARRRNRLCERAVIALLRVCIERRWVGAGTLAGLADPRLTKHSPSCTRSRAATGRSSSWPAGWNVSRALRAALQVGRGRDSGQDRDLLDPVMPLVRSKGGELGFGPRSFPACRARSRSGN